MSGGSASYVPNARVSTSTRRIPSGSSAPDEACGSRSSVSRCSPPGSPAQDPAAAVDHDAVAVEQQVVLAADDVDVGDDRVVLRRAAGHQGEAHLVFACYERAGVDDEQEAGSRVEDASDRTAVSPQVFADDERHVDIADADDQQLVARDEDAVLVEDGVVGQVVLRGGRHDTPALEDARAVLGDGRRGVRGVEETGLERAVGVTDHDGQIAEALALEPLGEGLDRPAAGNQEAGPRGQVFDGVAGEAHLAGGEEVGPCGAGSPGRFEQLLGVAREVSDDGVRLCERQAESGHSH